MLGCTELPVSMFIIKTDVGDVTAINDFFGVGKIFFERSLLCSRLKLCKKMQYKQYLDILLPFQILYPYVF